MVAVPHRELYIDGRWIQPASNGRLDVISPATEAVVGTIPRGGAVDVHVAVAAARKSFYDGPWSKYTGHVRATYLRKIAEKVFYELSLLASVVRCNKIADLKSLLASYTGEGEEERFGTTGNTG